MDGVTRELLEFATPAQAQAIEAYIEHGTIRKAGVAVGCSHKNIHKLITKAKRKAAMAGHAPDCDMVHKVPDPFVVKGTSTLYDEDGKVRSQWVKTQLDDKRRLELLREVVDEMKEEIKPCKPIKREQVNLRDELLNFYVLSDIHLGALSWEPETGADWDLDIAERTIFEAFNCTIRESPKAAHGFFCQLGDALHFDSMLPVTPTSGHVVDADSRYHKVVRTTIRIFRKVVRVLLESHERVTVLMAQGNHDLSGSAWLQEVFKVLYEDEPRVNVIVNPSPYYSHVHGKTFLGMHHGHKRNINQLAEHFSGKRYWADLGTCRQAYIHTGHRHHRQLKETPSGIIEMHPTLAAPSSHDSSGGYDSDRSMACIAYHAKGREHSRHLFYPE